MTAAVHRHYVKFGYELDRTQTARLLHISAKAPLGLHGLAREIKETGIGVEQEIIDVDAESRLS